MSYTIDVYRGEARVQKNLLDFGVYVAMFPQLIHHFPQAQGHVGIAGKIKINLEGKGHNAHPCRQGAHLFS